MALRSPSIADKALCSVMMDRLLSPKAVELKKLITSKMLANRANWLYERDWIEHWVEYFKNISGKDLSEKPGKMS